MSLAVHLPDGATSFDEAASALRTLAAVMAGARLVKTLPKGGSTRRPSKAKDIEKFVFQSGIGNATLHHGGAQQHEWMVEPTDSRVVRLQLNDVMPTGLGRETIAAAGHGGIANELARLAAAVEGPVHEADVTEHLDLTVRIHTVTKRDGFDAVSTQMRLAGPVLGAYAVGRGANGLTCCQLTDLGRRTLETRPGRHVQISSLARHNLFQFAAMSYVASDRDLADPMEALRVNLRAGDLPSGMFRTAGRRR